ncbi:MAG: type II toxin-antitoxin system HicB family antitoxin [Candidatus Korobacteraceae bacterium]
MRVAVQAEFKLFGVIKRQGDWYVAYCPPLDITTQGRTLSEAKENLQEASYLFMVSCFERGTFEQAMRELGWSVAKGSASTEQGRRLEIPEGAFHFPIPIPFGFEKTAGCHA